MYEIKLNVIEHPRAYARPILWYGTSAFNYVALIENKKLVIITEHIDLDVIIAKQIIDKQNKKIKDSGILITFTPDDTINKHKFIYDQQIKEVYGIHNTNNIDKNVGTYYKNILLNYFKINIIEDNVHRNAGKFDNIPLVNNIFTWDKMFGGTSINRTDIDGICFLNDELIIFEAKTRNIGIPDDQEKILVYIADLFEYSNIFKVYHDWRVSEITEYNCTLMERYNGNTKKWSILKDDNKQSMSEFLSYIRKNNKNK